MDETTMMTVGTGLDVGVTPATTTAAKVGIVGAIATVIIFAGVSAYTILADRKTRKKQDQLLDTQLEIADIQLEEVKKKILAEG